MISEVVVAMISTVGSMLTVIVPLLIKNSREQKKAFDMLKAGLKAGLKPQLQQLHAKQCAFVSGKKHPLELPDRRYI